MHPAGSAPLGSRMNERTTRPPLAGSSITQSHTQSRRPQTEDSWVEISSQPSSTSISSISDNDVVTTGLHIQRPRMSRQAHSFQLHLTHEDTPVLRGPSSAAGSSQDEYEESESESDRVLNSSNEDLTRLVGDDDDSSTALGVPDTEHSAFTPQPNAFSHPPSSRVAGSEPSPYFPTVNHEPRLLSNEARSNRGTNHRTHDHRVSLPRSFPSNRTSVGSNGNDRTTGRQDHDAALRASLTTLLSCAAAVRSSPKAGERSTAPDIQQNTRNTPITLRLVPESELSGDVPTSPSHTSGKRRSEGKNVSSPAEPAFVKRKARDTGKERQVKKARSNASKNNAPDQDLAISPTVMSWMISAGIVIVFSAVSFSAGYAWGREVGRVDAEMGSISTSACGREALRSSGSGLRRLKWTTAASSIRA